MADYYAVLRYKHPESKGPRKRNIKVRGRNRREARREVAKMATEGFWDGDYFIESRYIREASLKVIGR